MSSFTSRRVGTQRVHESLSGFPFLVYLSSGINTRHKRKGEPVSRKVIRVSSLPTRVLTQARVPHTGLHCTRRRSGPGIFEGRTDEVRKGGKTVRTCFSRGCRWTLSGSIPSIVLVFCLPRPRELSGEPSFNELVLLKVTSNCTHSLFETINLQYKMVPNIPQLHVFTTSWYLSLSFFYSFTLPATCSVLKSVENNENIEKTRDYNFAFHQIKGRLKSLFCTRCFPLIYGHGWQRLFLLHWNQTVLKKVSSPFLSFFSCFL